MSLEKRLDLLHTAFTKNRWLQIFTVFARLLLAVGFIPPSIPKILHRPFTVLPDSNPVGHYFNALYQTGFYYEFLGWSQIAAALLLLFPRTAHLGALMFLPIIVNIAVLTTSVGFKGTWLITILMASASAWLVFWEYDRLKAVLFAERTHRPHRLPKQFLLLPLFFGVGGIGVALIWKAIGLGNFSNYLNIAVLLAVSGSLFGLLCAVHLKFMRVGKLSSKSDSFS